MNEADKRELANFLDTEGFIGITCVKKGNRFIPMIFLVNTDLAWLEAVKGKWGGTISPHKNRGANCKRSWQWHIHGESLLYVLDAVRPYLKIKAEPCGLCRELQYRISHKVGVDHHNRLTPQERDTRAELHRKCKLLTARGPRGEQLPLAEPKAQLSLPL